MKKYYQTMQIGVVLAITLTPLLVTQAVPFNVISEDLSLTEDRDGNGISMNISVLDAKSKNVLGSLTDFSIIDRSSAGYKGFIVDVDVGGENSSQVDNYAFVLERLNKNGIITESKKYVHKKIIGFAQFLDSGVLDAGVYRLSLKANSVNKASNDEVIYFGVTDQALNTVGTFEKVKRDLQAINEGDEGGNDPHHHGHIKNNNAFLMAMGDGSRIEIHGNTASKRSWTHLDATAEKGTNVITVSDLTRWKVGDSIAITSTDYEPEQAEDFIIIAVSSDERTFTLNKPLAYMHYGETQHVANGKGREWVINERAQVALLSRNVTITGDADAHIDHYGGHTMVMNGAEMHISGVEFTKMGQEGILGRYPTHWHMLGDAGAGQYIKNSSYHNTFNKGITVHGTHQTLIQDNVVYNTLGHSYFMEDGSETGNLFQRNIGFGSKTVSKDTAILKSDVVDVSTFWITNPHNDFVGNVAGGSENGGFWYAIGRDFTGLSKENTLFEHALKPYQQVAGLFNDNIAHSSFAGLLKTQNTDEGISSYAKNDLEIYKFNTFKNRTWSANLTTAVGSVDIYDSVIASAPDGLNFNDNTSIQGSLSYGVSPNIGNPNTDKEISLGYSLAKNGTSKDIRMEGLAFYSGEFFFEDSHFGLFNKEGYFAISSKQGAGLTNYVKNISFDNDFERSVSFSFPLGKSAGRAGRAIYDADGDLSGYQGAWLTQAANEANSSAGSFIHPEFDVFVIQDAHITELNEKGKTGDVGPDLLTRYPSVDGTRAEESKVRGVGGRTQLAIIGDGNDYVYVYDFGSRALEHRQNRINLSSANSNEYVFIESPNATNLHGVEGAIRVGSFAQLKVAPQKAYFYENGRIYVKIFGGGSDKDDANQGVVKYILLNEQQLITTVPNIPYEPIKYTQSQLAEFVPKKLAPTRTFDIEKATHNPSAFEVRVSDTVNVSLDDARWSNTATWNGALLPNENNIIVIGPGERVVLNQDVKVKAIVIDGGEMIIEDMKDIALSADWILVLNEGIFQVGTEEAPFIHSFKLTLEGDSPNNSIDIMTLRTSNDPNIMRLGALALTAEL